MGPRYPQEPPGTVGTPRNPQEPSGTQKSTPNPAKSVVKKLGFKSPREFSSKSDEISSKSDEISSKKLSFKSPGRNQ